MSNIKSQVRIYPKQHKWKSIQFTAHDLSRGDAWQDVLRITQLRNDVWLTVHVPAGGPEGSSVCSNPYLHTKALILLWIGWCSVQQLTALVFAASLCSRTTNSVSRIRGDIWAHDSDSLLRSSWCLVELHGRDSTLWFSTKTCIISEVSVDRNLNQVLILTQISGGSSGFLCLHMLMLLAGKNSPNWIRIKHLRLFMRKKEIIVTRGNNTPIISMASRLMKAMGLIPREQSPLRGRREDAKPLEPYWPQANMRSLRVSRSTWGDKLSLHTFVLLYQNEFNPFRDFSFNVLRS